MASYTELMIDQGSNFDLTIYIVDERTNQRANLAGYTIRSSLKRNFQAANTYAAFTTQVVNGAEGIITISLDAQSTAAIKAGRYMYDVEAEDNDGRVTRLLEGTATITPEVTR